MSKQTPVEVEWVGDSLKQVRLFPQPVRQDIGNDLFDLQSGDMLLSAKPLKGIGTGVVEIVTRHDKDTYRTVVALKLAHRIYVLHAFQKKSKQGIKTPPREINLIKQRYRLALDIDKGYQNEQDK